MSITTTQRSLTTDGLNYAKGTVFVQSATTPSDGQFLKISGTDSRGNLLAEWATPTTSDIDGLGGSIDDAVILAPESSTRNVIQPTGDYVPLSIKARGAQTANLTEWVGSGGTPLSWIRNDGSLFVQNAGTNHAVYGASTSGDGIHGASSVGFGVYGQGSYGVVGTGISGGQFSAVTGSGSAILLSHADALGKTLSTFNTSSQETITFQEHGAAVFNEQGANADFRIEGDTVPNLFVVDASADNVGIGTASPAYRLDVRASGGVAAIGGSTSSGIGVYGFGSLAGVLGATSAAAPGIKGQAANAGGSAGDFHNTNSSGAVLRVLDTAGSLVLSSFSADASVVFNEQGTSTGDLRLEGDTMTHLLFSDASADSIGINHATPTSTLHLGGSFARKWVAKSVDYTMTATDDSVVVDTAGKTITLPTAVGISDRVYTVKNISSGTVYVASTSSQTFDGLAGPVALAAGTAYNFHAVSSNWIIT